jgi:hypothetical protein
MRPGSRERRNIIGEGPDDGVDSREVLADADATVPDPHTPSDDVIDPD